MKYEILASRRVHVSHIIDAPSEEEAYDIFFKEEMAGKVEWEDEDDSSVDIDEIVPVEEKCSPNCAGCYGG